MRLLAPETLGGHTMDLQRRGASSSVVSSFVVSNSARSAMQVMKTAGEMVISGFYVITARSVSAPQWIRPAYSTEVPALLWKMALLTASMGDQAVAESVETGEDVPRESMIDFWSTSGNGHPHWGESSCL